MAHALAFPADPHTPCTCSAGSSMQLESVHVHVFCAGRVPVKAAQAALSSARSELRNAAQKQAAVWGVVEGGAAVTGEATQETSATAVGDGAGVTIVARTTTGCIIGGCALVGQAWAWWYCNRRCAGFVDVLLLPHLT